MVELLSNELYFSVVIFYAGIAAYKMTLQHCYFVKLRVFLGMGLAEPVHVWHGRHNTVA